MPAWNKDDPLERAIAEDGRRETKRANQAFRDYALMGAGRSLGKLFAIFSTTRPPDAHQILVTKSLNTLKTWSTDFFWVARANRFDELQAEKDKAAS